MSKVSVIIPCFNQGMYLSEAVQSVISQTHQDWECIIVNDGSTDDTDQIANEWTASDVRIKYIRKTNGGLSSARNAGLRLALGNYIQFLDADDYIHPEKMSIQLTALASMPKDTVAICDHFPFDCNSREFAQRFYKSPFLDEKNYKQEIVSEWEFRKSIPCHNFLIPKTLIDQNNLCFYENLTNHEDWVFWCEMIFYSSGICYQQDKLAYYRMRPGSMVTNKELMAEGFLEATFILENFYRTKNATDYVSLVLKIRKEIKNNLFPYSTSKKIYSIIAREAKQLLGLNQHRMDLFF